MRKGAKRRQPPMAAWIGTACSNARNAVGQVPTLFGPASGPRCLGLAHGYDAIDNPHVCTGPRHPSVNGSGPLWKLSVQDASGVGSVWKATSASGATRATIHRRRLDAAQGERLFRHGVRRPIGCGPAPFARLQHRARLRVNGQTQEASHLPGAIAPLSVDSCDENFSAHQWL